VFSVDGKRVLEGTFDPVTDTIDFSTLAADLYILEINGSQHKIVKL